MFSTLRRKLGNPRDAAIHLLLAFCAGVAGLEWGWNWLFWLAREQRDVAAHFKHGGLNFYNERVLPHPWLPWEWRAHTHLEHLAGLAGALLALWVRS